MEGAVQHHRGTLGWWAVGYHFLVGIERAVNQAQQQVAVLNGRPWRNEGGHGGPNGNTRSIGIAAIGDFNTADNDSNRQLRGTIRQQLENLIADCLISFPRHNANGIERVSRVGHALPVLTSGIMRHADVCSGNPTCPGTHLGVNNIIQRAINTANWYDSVVLLRNGGVQFDDAIENPIEPVNWATNPRDISSYAEALTLLCNSGLIPENEVSKLHDNQRNTDHLHDLLVGVAKWTPINDKVVVDTKK